MLAIICCVSLLQLKGLGREKVSASGHLGAAEPWSPFCGHRELELVDRESTGSDGHSPISVATANKGQWPSYSDFIALHVYHKPFHFYAGMSHHRL